MNNANLQTQKAAFKLKGSFFPLSVLHLINPNMERVAAQLDGIVQQAPNLLKNAPVIIDLDTLDTGTEIPNFDILSSVLRSYGLIPIGVAHASDEQATAAINAGLVTLQLPTETRKPNIKVGKTADQSSLPTSEHSKGDHATTTPSQQNAATKVITTPIRSGQQIYAKNADLIVLNSVSPGAEILADGHIHVYGALRGRALAGVSGDKNARIFCQMLEAELVSIAGCYMLHEDVNIPKNTQAMQIYLQDEQLRIDALA